MSEAPQLEKEPARDAVVDAGTETPDGDKTPSVDSASAGAKVDEEAEALDGYVLDPALYPDGAANLKITPDGRYVLIPQPHESPNDPLNWSPGRKATIVAIIAFIAALADYTGGTAIITVLPQAGEWQMSQYAVQQAVVGNIFMIGVCGLFVVALASYFGRMPVLLVFQAVMVGTCAWSAAATSFESYMAARIINGFFCSVGQGGALMWIKDLFYFHEHPRVINIVEFSIILSPYLGPLVAAFVVSGTTWRWAFWICTILSAIALVAVFFVDETLYDRHVPAADHAPRVSRWKRLVGIEQGPDRRRRSFLHSVARPVVALSKVPILAILVYYFLNFAWVIGVNTTISIWLSNFYGFTPRDLGFFYFFGIVGVLLGWLAGHWAHDSFGRFYARRHGGRIDAEARLMITYPATLLLGACLIVLGFAIERQWHYMVLAVFAALQCFSVMIVTTAINAYLLDCYPEGSGEVSAWVTAARNWSGFMATYIQIPWVQGSGAAKAFGVQAAITFASALIIVFLQLYGKRIRKWQGRMVFGAKSAKKV